MRNRTLLIMSVLLASCSPNIVAPIEPAPYVALPPKMPEPAPPVVKPPANHIPALTLEDALAAAQHSLRAARDRNIARD